MEEEEKETHEEDFPISHVSASVTCNHTLWGGAPPPGPGPLMARWTQPCVYNTDL